MVAALPVTTKWAVALGDGLRHATAGSAARFTVACRDSAGRPLPAPDASALCLSVRLARSEVDDNPLPSVTVRPQSQPPPPLDVHQLQADVSRDGTSLEVSYLIRRAGECLLHVELSGTPVHGSPFSVTVKPGCTSATTSSAQGAGLSRAMVGSEAAFVITAFDAFGNRKYTGGDRFYGTLTTPPGSEPSTVIANCEVVDCEDGTYLGLFTPAHAHGACPLHIKLGDAPLRSSPFQVEVVAC